jgi:hypothetical protein
MSLIGSRANLTHRCTIQRDEAEADDWGNPGPADWQTHLEDVRCRFWVPTGQDIAAGTTVTAVDDARLIVPLGTDVTTNDRVSAVTARSAVLVPGPLTIRAVLPRADHIELVLKRVA